MDIEDIGVLIVDDEPAVRNSLHSWFEKDGYRTDKAADALEAMDKLSTGSWEIVLLDIKMPGINGMDLQKRIMRNAPETVVIMVTAFATVETAVEALKEGAFDYVSKPIDPEKLSEVVRKAAEHINSRKDETQLQTNIGGPSLNDCLIGESPEIKKVLKLINAASKTDEPVLIRGDQGTGKELVARLIHANSHRRFFPLVAVSCGSLGVALLQSELFGHEQASVKGVEQERKGKVEMADGGTLFMDDFGALDLDTQTDLLRVIETRQFNRLEGIQPVPVDLRIICSTTDDLGQLVRDDLFSEVLYHRVNSFQIEIPALSDRRSDIPLLAAYFIKKSAGKINRAVSDITKPAVKALMEYDWPGNIRELENTIKRAVAVSTGPTIELQDLPSGLADGGKRAQDDSLETVEKAHIANVLEKTSWNISKTAKKLGVDRTTLYSKIKKYGLNK